MIVENILFTLICAAFICIGRIFWWIYQHNKNCHTKPLVDIEVTKLAVTQLKEHCERNSENIHGLREEFSAPALYFQMLGEGKIPLQMRTSNPQHTYQCPHYADSLAPCTCGADGK